MLSKMLWLNDGKMGKNKGVWMSCSKASIHQGWLELICQGLSISDLDSLQTEIICLEKEKLENVQNALARIVKCVESGVPSLGQNVETDSLFNYLYRHEGLKELSTDLHLKAFAEAEPSFDLPLPDESGYGSLLGFYA
jgi:hypothetical protein